jgi:hypothetical protein
MVAYTPPAAPAYMLSLLARRFASIGDAFKQQYGGHWLVWEPGQWSASGVFDPTQSPKGAPPPAGMGDSLTFHMKTPQRLKLGRSSTCDMVINDGTVSREHLLFEPAPSGWKVKVLSAHGASQVAGVPYKLNNEVTLDPGASLRVGDVALTFLDAERLLVRLAAMR